LVLILFNYFKYYTIISACFDWLEKQQLSDVGISVRETGASRYHEGPIKGPLKPL